MKYDAAKNKKILQGRLKTSLGVENAWYPLSFNDSFYDRNPRVVANAYGGVCSPVQQTERRAALLEKSAHLVVIGNECIGIRSGDVSFPFRIPVVVDLDTVADALIICLLHIYLCSDLLALATLIGHPGQAGCSCMWCRVCAANTKRTAADVTIQFPYRTPASEAIDLAAFRSKTGAKPTPVNGVLMPPLLPITDYMKVMMPVLHCFLGLVNFVVQRINKVGILIFFHAPYFHIGSHDHNFCTRTYWTLMLLMPLT